MNKKVLTIDDDPAIGKLIELILKPLEISVCQANSGSEGLMQAYRVQPDLIILDIMMPGMDGFEVCSRIRQFSSVPILMLTARVHENDVMRGFRAGANDYLKKPFSKVEFVARVCALLARQENLNPGSGSFFSAYIDPYLEIDLSSKTVKVKGILIDLSPKEFDLLACLVREQRTVKSHRELVREVWGEWCADDTSVSSLYIYYLRKKLKDGQFGHRYIRTQWGRGYWFEPRAGDNAL